MCVSGKEIQRERDRRRTVRARTGGEKLDSVSLLSRVFDGLAVTCWMMHKKDPQWLLHVLWPSRWAYGACFTRYVSSRVRAHLSTVTYCTCNCVCVPVCAHMFLFVHSDLTHSEQHMIFFHWCMKFNNSPCFYLRRCGSFRVGKSVYVIR